MQNDLDDLDALFAEARDEAKPSPTLSARVLADADRVLRESEYMAAPEPSGGLFSWMTAIGGWRGAGGLIAATVAGVMIGFSAPEAIDEVLGGQLSFLGLVESSTLLPGLDDLLPVEGG